MVKQIENWITTRYGTRRGFLRTSEHRLMGYMGRYQRYRRINWGRVGRLVFVCKGNICRSAFAEVVAKSLGLDAISCGLEASSGAAANAQAVSMAARKGFDLGSHRSQPIADVGLRDEDLLVAMEPQQAHSIGALTDRCTLLGVWGVPRLPYIHDPYGTSDQYFEHCFSYIEKSVNEVAVQINRSRN